MELTGRGVYVQPWAQSIDLRRMLRSNDLLGGAPTGPRATPAPRIQCEQNGTDEKPPIPDSDDGETKPTCREQIARLNQSGCQPEQQERRANPGKRVEETARRALAPRHHGSQSHRHRDDTHGGYQHIESPFPRGRERNARPLSVQQRVPASRPDNVEDRKHRSPECRGVGHPNPNGFSRGNHSNIVRHRPTLAFSGAPLAAGPLLGLVGQQPSPVR